MSEYLTSALWRDVVRRSNGIRFVTDINPIAAKKAIMEATARTECIKARATIAALKITTFPTLPRE